MKTGMTLTALAVEIERQANDKQDYAAPSTALRVETTERGTDLAVGDAALVGARPWALDQIAQEWNVPVAYARRVRESHPDLYDHTLNTLMHREPRKRMVRVLDGAARAVLSHRYRPLDNIDLAEVALATLHERSEREGHELKVESCALTESRMYIKALFPRLQADVKVGDTVQAGLVISNSEVGQGSLRVEPLIYRLVCLNGMISGTALKRFHLGRGIEADQAVEIYRDETIEADDRAFWLKVRDVIANAMDEAAFARAVDRMRETTEQPIEGDVVKVVEQAQRTLKLSDGERSSVLTHLIQGGDMSRYGLLNAITRASQDVDDYDRATELERMGGQVIELPRKEWTRIALAA